MLLPHSVQPAKPAGFKAIEPDPKVLALADRSLLIVDDDRPFALRLERAMAQRGFIVKVATSQAEARAVILATPPAFAVVDLRLGDGNGLELVQLLTDRRPDSKPLVLTGYGNFTSVVNAMKHGAASYLAKPADGEEILAELLASGAVPPSAPEMPMTAERVKWEHILRVYELCNGNVSDTARRLHMHRRTVQRMLSKRAPR